MHRLAGSVPSVSRSALAAVALWLALGSGLTGCSLGRQTEGTRPAQPAASSVVAAPSSGPGSAAGAVSSGSQDPTGTPGSSGSPAAAVPGVVRDLPPIPERWASWPSDRPLFPQSRLVGFSGYPGAPGQGRLGVGSLDDRVDEIVQNGLGYTAGGRQVIPTLELIAVTVQGSPGRDGKYRTRASDEVIRRHVVAARRVGGLVLLNIQPGRADFLTEAKALEHWLREPDVALALDPEWRMGPGEVPMRVFGHVTGKELDSVASYLSGLVGQYRLPPKVMLFHQLNAKIVRDQQALRPHPGVAIIKAVDGIGSAAMKLETWRKLTKGLPAHIRPGFKLFFQEDREFGPLMTPKQVLALKPTVDYVLYE